MAVGVNFKGFNGLAMADGEATTTSNVIRLDSPWSTPYVKFVVAGALSAAANCQMKISPDGTNWLNHGAVIASGTSAATVMATSTYGLPNSGYVCFTAAGGTDDTVTIDTWVSVVSVDGQAPSSPIQ